MLQYRTDLAMEAHELLCAKSRAQTLSGVDSRTVFRRGCSVTRRASSASPAGGM